MLILEGNLPDPPVWNLDQRVLYHCPNWRCRRDFVNLGGVVEHLERETCGYLRFERVEKETMALMNNTNRQIGF